MSNSSLIGLKRLRRIASLGWYGGGGLLACVALRAADVTWLSAVGGDWATAANWSSHPSLPGSSDGVTIAATTGGTDPYTVTFGTGTADDADLTATIANLALGASGAPYVTLQLKGGTFTADTGASTVVLTMNNSSLNVETGATLYLRTADETGTAGLASLSMKGGATVTVGGSLISEKAGGGGTNPRAGLIMSAEAGASNTFTVVSGGAAQFGYSNIGASGSAATATNTVVVDGGSLWFRSLNIGVAGNDNQVIVKNGGNLTVGSSGAGIGGGTGVSGKGQLVIGERDGGTVISEGTVTYSSTLTLGTRGSSTSGTGGQGTIILNAGTFTTNSGITLGGGTGGAITQGTISVNGGTFAINATAARTVTVGGLDNSTGTFNITGGTVNLTRTQGDHTLVLAPNVTTGTGTGTLNLSGGTLNVDKFLSQTAAGTINFTSGLFTVKQATVSNGKAFTVGDGVSSATLRLMTGTGSGAHTFADGLAISANARLEGAGTVGNITTVGGAIGATGALTFADGLALLNGATLDLDGGGSISVTGGALTIADGASINVRLTAFTAGQAVTLFSVVGTAPSLDGVQFLFNGVESTGSWNGSQFQITASAIPEPSSLALLAAGAALVAAGCRRRGGRA